MVFFKLRDLRARRPTSRVCVSPPLQHPPQPRVTGEPAFLPPPPPCAQPGRRYRYRYRYRGGSGAAAGSPSKFLPELFLLASPSALTGSAELPLRRKRTFPRGKGLFPPALPHTHGIPPVISPVPLAGRGGFSRFGRRWRSTYGCRSRSANPRFSYY